MTISHGAKQLKDWLDKQDHNQEWLAAQLTEARGGERVYQSSVSAYLRGAQVPLWVAIAVQKLTGIALEAWVPAVPDSATSIAEDDDAVRSA